MDLQITRETIKNLPKAQFKQLCSALQDNADAQKDVLIHRMRYDLELFSTVCFPHFSKHPFNSFHQRCFSDWTEPKRNTRRADAAPRGSAKSTLKALIKPIHDLCYGLERYVVVLSNTAEQADAKLKDIRRELLENRYLHYFFGSFFSTRKVPETHFVATAGGHQCMFQSFGSGAEIRGIRFGAFRPSKIICDDVEHSDEVHNEEIRRKYADWFKEVISQMGDEETNIEVIGTMLHKDSLLANLLVNPAYESEIFKSIISWSAREDLWEKWRKIYGNLENSSRMVDADAFYESNKIEMLKGTQVLWPEKESYLDLMKLMFEIGRKAFMKERQNEPIASDQAIFDRFHLFAEVTEGLRINATGVIVPWVELEPFGVMDPATGQKKARAGKSSDYTCLLSGYRDTKGRLFVHSDWTRRAAPSVYIDAIFEHHETYKYEKFGVETNLYRNLLLPNILTAKREREERNRAAGKKPWGINMSFYDIEAVDNKEKRIFTLEPKVTNGFILFNETLSQEFKTQMESFPLGEHDDCPDALEMLWAIANGRYKMSSVDLRTHQGR